MTQGNVIQGNVIQGNVNQDTEEVSEYVIK